MAFFLSSFLPADFGIRFQFVQPAENFFTFFLTRLFRVTRVHTNARPRQGKFMTKPAAKRHVIPTKTLRPDAQKSGSLQSAIADLTIGMSTAKVDPVDPALTLVEVAEILPDLRENIRNTAGGAVRRASARSGNGYTVEVIDAKTTSGKLYVIAIITCTGPAAHPRVA